MLSRLRRIHALMEEDETRELAELHQRDRAVGERLAHLRARPQQQILAWSRARGIDEAPADRAERRIAGALWLGGFVLGGLTAAGALYFEGGGRVNVIALLALLVGVQLIMVLLSVLAMLPARVRRAVPGLATMLDALSVLSPPRAALAGMRRFAPRLADSLQAVTSASARESRLFARVRRWTLWHWSQGFAVAFNLGLIACFLALVVFTDLAFGWSTTLEMPAATVHSLTGMLALPWRDLFPQAVPGIELIELTRYFRAGGATRVDPLVLGAWWRFVLAALIVYGLGPRVALYAWACWRRARAVRWTVLHLPQSAELLYRLNNELVTTHDDAVEAPPEQPTGTAGRLSLAPASGPCMLVLWGLEDADRARVVREVQIATGLDPIEHRSAGGARSIDDDRQVIEAVASSSTPLVVAVKSWEPPLAELADFLTELRHASSEARALVVVPIGIDGTGARASDITIWRERLARLGDPWLSVRALGASEAS